jgi:hypothetical protein
MVVPLLLDSLVSLSRYPRHHAHQIFVPVGTEAGALVATRDIARMKYLYLWAPRPVPLQLDSTLHSYLRPARPPALQRTRDICTWRAGGLAGLLDPATIVEGHRPRCPCRNPRHRTHQIFVPVGTEAGAPPARGCERFIRLMCAL